MLSSLSYECKRNESGVNLNPSYLIKLFSNPDSAKSGLYHKQFEDNIIDESINFAENNYILSENVYNLTKEMSRNSTIILMHLNIRSLPQNFDKLKILVLSMKIKPRVISLNETWIKRGHMGEFNYLSDYVLISNSREKSPGGGVAFYIHKSLS